MNHPILIMLSVVLLLIVTDSASAIAERHISTSASDRASPRASPKDRQRRIRTSNAITKELIKYYKRGLSVDVAMKTSAVVRKVVDKLQRNKMLPDIKRGKSDIFGKSRKIPMYRVSLKYWDTFIPYCPNIWIILLPHDVSKNCCMNGKQCRPWSDAVLSGFTLFAQACVSQYIWITLMNAHCHIWNVNLKKSPDDVIKLMTINEAHWTIFNKRYRIQIKS